MGSSRFPPEEHTEPLKAMLAICSLALSTRGWLRCSCVPSHSCRNRTYPFTFQQVPVDYTPTWDGGLSPQYLVFLYSYTCSLADPLPQLHPAQTTLPYQEGQLCGWMQAGSQEAAGCSLLFQDMYLVSFYWWKSGPWIISDLSLYALPLHALPPPQ